MRMCLKFRERLIGMAMNRILGNPTWFGVICVWILSMSTAYIVTLFINTYIPWILDLRKLRTAY